MTPKPIDPEQEVIDAVIRLGVIIAVGIVGLGLVALALFLLW